MADLLSCVSAVRAESLREVLIRSYATDEIGQQNYDCAIWEAVRATSAAPGFFEPITLRGVNAPTFVDGGLRANNPIELMISESQSVWSDPLYGCVISIGTGIVPLKPIASKSPKLHSLVQSIENITTDAEVAARRFIRTNTGRSVREANRYYRFNVDQGMTEVDLADTEKMSLMKAMSEAYLEDHSHEIQACAKVLAFSPSSVRLEDVHS